MRTRVPRCGPHSGSRMAARSVGHAAVTAPASPARRRAPRTTSSTSPTTWTDTASSTSAGTSSRSGSLRSGHEHLGQAGSLGGEQLLLQTADREHPAVEGDLAGHADLGADRTAGRERGQRGDHRDAGRRSVLGRRARGHVDVDRLVLEERRVDAEVGCVGPHEGKRDLRGLLHHVTELAGQRQAGGPLVRRCLDEEDIAAEAGDGQAGRDTGHRGALGDSRA